MPIKPDDLASIKDDMVAFIEGHGMRRFHGYVDYEEVQSVIWKSQDSDNVDAWKDFVELAKAAGAPFLTMDWWRLQREELEAVIERLGSAEFSSEEDMEDARWLGTYRGKTGFVQLGFAHQGVMMVYEASTEWYDRYQRLLELAEDFGGMPMDEAGQDDEA
jgi:hypothetical protein